VPNPWPVVTLAKRLASGRTDVLQTWMWHADLIGGLAAKLVGRMAVAWGIHHADLNLRQVKWSSILTICACARCSSIVPDRVVCCSEASRQGVIRAGYARDKVLVIPNGFEVTKFVPDENARLSIRRELGIGTFAPLVGIVARFHPQKDHRTFVGAAARIASHRSDVHFLLCGDKVDHDNAELWSWIHAAGIQDRCHLLGCRGDIARIMASLDVLVLSSLFGEAFPNVIGEAMACGVPCAVTDVGESAAIVGDMGRVVPRSQPGDLAAACLELIGLPRDVRHKLSIAARERIARYFDISVMVSQYQDLHEELADVRHRWVA
jgi:glycosyltransferase involved in cell wall biosynthesis